MDAGEQRQGSKMQSTPELASHYLVRRNVRHGPNTYIPGGGGVKLPMVEKVVVCCTICLEPFKDPKVLPCCHTYCKVCLEKILEVSYVKDRLFCPQCRAEHQLPQNGPGGFLTNFTVLDEIRLSESKTRNKTPTCQMCDEDNSAVSYCSDCSAYLCDFCSQAHKKVKAFKSHDVLLYDESSPDIEAIGTQPDHIHCSKHPDEELRAFCKSCKCLACCSCIIDSHQNHTLCLVNSSTLKEVQTEINDLVAKVEKKLLQFEGNLQYIEEVKKEVFTRPHELKSAVIKAFDSIIATIESRKAELLEQAESSSNASLKELWSQKDYVSTAVVGLKDALSFSKHSLQCSNVSQALALSSQIVGRLKELNQISWDDNSTQNIEHSRSVFSQEDLTQKLQKLGNINLVADLEVSNIPDSAEISKEVTFEVNSRILVHAPGKASRKTDKKSSLRLSVKVVDDNNVSITPNISEGIQKKGSSNKRTWSVSFIPVSCGIYTIKLFLGSREPSNTTDFELEVTEAKNLHTGIWQCCTYCATNGHMNVPCGCGSNVVGYKGCGHGHPGHPGCKHWSCCGSTIQSSVTCK